MGDSDIFIVIGGILLIFVVLFFGSQLFFSFYDFDSFDGEGELGIDTDSIDDLGESMEDASDAVFDNYDFDELANSLLVIVGAGFAMIIGVFIATVIISKVFR